MNSESTLSDALSEVDVALAAHNHDRAVALANELLTAYPDSVGVWRMRARTYEAAGRAQSAADAYGRVLDFLPGDSDAMAALARSLHAANNENEARLWARQALDYRPNDALLQRIAGSSEQPPRPDAQSQLLRSALALCQVGLFQRSIAGLQQVSTQRPDRIDAKVALASALWRNSARVAAAEVCQSILDEQPDCLNAHLILLQFWREAAAPLQEQYHLGVIDRIDPDHRVTAQLLGAKSPLTVTDVSATRALALMPPDEDAQSRADFVDGLIAAASSTPRPLDRTDRANGADVNNRASNDQTRAPDASAAEDTDGDALDDVDVVDAGEVEAFAPWEWAAADDINEDREDGFDLPWLKANPNDTSPRFVPSKPASVTPDPKDGVPDEIEPLEWSKAREGRDEDRDERRDKSDPTREHAPAQDEPDTHDAVDADTTGTRGATVVTDVDDTVGGSTVVTDVDATDDDATVVTDEDDLDDDATVVTDVDDMGVIDTIDNDNVIDASSTDYKKLIPTLRGKQLDALIAELESSVRAQSKSKSLLDALGQAYARKGNLPAALDAYRRAMELE